MHHRIRSGVLAVLGVGLSACCTAPEVAPTEPSKVESTPVVGEQPKTDFDRCVAQCTFDNQMVAKSAEAIEADCRQECASKE